MPGAPAVLRTRPPEAVKDKMAALFANLYETDLAGAYGVAAGDSLGFVPITQDAYVSIIEARKAKSN